MARERSPARETVVDDAQRDGKVAMSEVSVGVPQVAQQLIEARLAILDSWVFPVGRAGRHNLSVPSCDTPESARKTSGRLCPPSPWHVKSGGGIRKDKSRA